MLKTNNDVEKVTNIKKMLIDISQKNKIGHVASSLSSVEILYTLYSKVANITPKNIASNDRDRVLISKEHCRMGHLAVLVELGLLDKEIAYEWGMPNGRVGHDIFNKIGCPEIAAIDVSFGTLGNSLGIASGLAIAKPDNIYVIVGDGELQEGSAWEALMFIGYHKIKNVITIVDRNFMQIGGYTKDIIDSSSKLEQQIKNFGFDIIVCNGHDVDDIEKALKTETELPKCILANTIKGKEFDFLIKEKGTAYLHSQAYCDDEYKRALEKLNA